MILGQSGKTIDDVIGKVNPPAGVPGAGNPVSEFGHVIGTLINLALLVAGILSLTYLIWGSLDIITSGGDKENIEKARNKLWNAIWGVLIFVIMLGVWTFITGSILGIVQVSDGFKFTLPTFRNSESAPGGSNPPDIPLPPKKGGEPIPPN